MRDLVTLLLILGAGAAYMSGLGPFFFGMPVIGTMLLAAGVTFELTAWWRVTHRTPHSNHPG